MELASITNTGSRSDSVVLDLVRVVFQARDRQECQAMVRSVVRGPGVGVVLEQHLCPDQRLVPVYHLRQPAGFQGDVVKTGLIVAAIVSSIALHVRFGPTVP